MRVDVRCTWNVDQNELLALKVLNEWFVDHGYSVPESTEEAWNVTTYKDTHISSPSDGRRANVLYLVRSECVISFSLFNESTEHTYTRAIL